MGSRGWKRQVRRYRPIARAAIAQHTQEVLAPLIREQMDAMERAWDDELNGRIFQGLAGIMQPRPRLPWEGPETLTTGTIGGRARTNPLMAERSRYATRKRRGPAR